MLEALVLMGGKPVLGRALAAFLLIQLHPLTSTGGQALMHLDRQRGCSPGCIRVILVRWGAYVHGPPRQSTYCTTPFLILIELGLMVHLQYIYGSYMSFSILFCLRCSTSNVLLFKLWWCLFGFQDCVVQFSWWMSGTSLPFLCLSISWDHVGNKSSFCNLKW